MVVDPKTANEFIDGYKEFLLYAAGVAGDNEEKELLDKLAFGRNAYLAEKELLSRFRVAKGKTPEWVLQAIERVQVSDWVYLRDTTKYSLFIKADQSAAYAVQGLTEPIKEIFGSSGIYLRAGVFPLGQLFVCDGLIAKLAHLGRNYREAFNDTYCELKSSGRFFKKPSA